MKQSNDCMGYQNYGGNKAHENRNAVKIKYIGNESKTLVNGEYYTFRQLGEAADVSPEATTVSDLSRKNLSLTVAVAARSTER